jgi:hypothetical protein
MLQTAKFWEEGLLEEAKEQGCDCSPVIEPPNRAWRRASKSGRRAPRVVHQPGCEWLKETDCQIAASQERLDALRAEIRED